ncbi:hypothetical protein HELRODRAFT_178313 [Helobdella robusta]|uniref:Uncharacterized protein n=1 Tax=Helobdella robusta TaxID=6412 RepID=T1FD25_HELRO|nr:hypothetical protein HELRODRAFT_178313 [Helobdella robusta]ESN97196.1 hypothetical protein HELRODRAFT_178313 [Helobdella robusta]
MEDETTSRRVDGADGKDRLNGGNSRRGRKILFLVMAGSGMIGAVVCTTLMASVLAAAACERRDATSEYEQEYSDPTTIKINGRLIFLWTSFKIAYLNCFTNLYTSLVKFKSAQSQELIRFSLSMENVADYCFLVVSSSNGLTYSKDPAVPLYNNQSIPEDVVSVGNYMFNEIVLAFNPSNNQMNTAFDFIEIEVALSSALANRGGGEGGGSPRASDLEGASKKPITKIFK